MFDEYPSTSFEQNLDIFAIAIGNQNGKEKFCKFTGFYKENLIVVSDNQIQHFEVFKISNFFVLS